MGNHLAAMDPGYQSYSGFLHMEVGECTIQIELIFFSTFDECFLINLSKYASNISKLLCLAFY